MPRPVIVQVVADGTPGGGTTVVLGLCEDLVRDGRWEVVLVSQAHSYALDMAGKMGIKAIGVAFEGSRLSASLVRQIGSLFEQLNPTIVHVHGARAGLPTALNSLVRARRFALVYTVHGLHFTLKSWPARVLGAAAEKLVAQRSDATVYVSNGDRDIARSWRILPAPSTKARVIFNGVEPADLQGSTAASGAADLVFVGRLVPQKNPLFVADIMAQLKDTNYTLAVVGGGELEVALRERLVQAGVLDRVTLHGKLDRAATLNVMRSARLCLFPSRWEGLPVTPIEAAYLGLPVVASDISGTDEVVLDGYNGKLLKTFDAAAYASAIRAVFETPGELKRLGANGRSLVEKNFLRDRCSGAYMEVYRSVAKRFVGSASTALPA